MLKAREQINLAVLSFNARCISASGRFASDRAPLYYLTDLRTSTVLQLCKVDHGRASQTSRLHCSRSGILSEIFRGKILPRQYFETLRKRHHFYAGRIKNVADDRNFSHSEYKGASNDAIYRQNVQDSQTISSIPRLSLSFNILNIFTSSYLRWWSSAITSHSSIWCRATTATSTDRRSTRRVSTIGLKNTSNTVV